MIKVVKISETDFRLNNLFFTYLNYNLLFYLNSNVTTTFVVILIALTGRIANVVSQNKKSHFSIISFCKTICILDIIIIFNKTFPVKGSNVLTSKYFWNCLLKSCILVYYLILWYKLLSLINTYDLKTRCLS